MTRAIVKAPGVNVLMASATDRRLLTLEAGRFVDVRNGRSWLRVEVNGMMGLVPAGAVEILTPEDAVGARQWVSSGIEPLLGCPNLVGEKILAHRDFHGALRRLNGYAVQCDIKIDVLHSFRQRDSWVDGLVLPPHKRSNHLVGHAIDMNLIVDGKRLNSRILNRVQWSELPSSAQKWIRLVRGDETLRWGGDFVGPDPVHIDDDLYRRQPSVWLRKLQKISASIVGPFNGRGSLNERS